MASLASLQKWTAKKAYYAADLWLDETDPFWFDEMELIVKRTRWRLNRWMRQSRIYVIANRVPRDPVSQAWATYTYASD